MSLFPKIYFGWWINLVSGLLSGLSHGFIALGGSALFKPIASELGLSRAMTSVANSLARLEGGVQAPVTGVLVDKFGARWLLTVGGSLMIIGLVWMNYVTSVWTYYIAWGLVIATGYNIGFTLTLDKVLADWFIRKRGLAFGLRFALLSLFGIIVLPTTSWMITTLGWRMACLVWAGVTLVTLLPSLPLIKRHRPEYYGFLPDGASAESGNESNAADMVGKGVEYASSFQELEFTLRQAMRTSSFWILALAFSIFGMFYASIGLHCIPFLTDVGIDPGAAAGMMSLMVFCQAPSRFIAGWLVDLCGIGRMQFLLAGTFLLQAMGLGVLLLNQSTAHLYVFLIVYGFATGGGSPLFMAIRGRYFGRKAFGSIQGASQLFGVPLSMLAPIFTGHMYDISGSYIPAFAFFAVVGIVTSALVCFIHPPEPPGGVSDIQKVI